MSQRRPTVLIVDDSLTVRMDLAEAFGDAGFSVHPCATAAKAREALAQFDVDVIILDVLLPDADGVDFLRELRQSSLGQSAAVMMLSSESQVKDRIRGYQTGADEYVGKPYDVAYMVARARELSTRARQARSPDADLATVLVVDDSPTVREHLREALEREGYLVLTAANGEEGLKMAALHRPAGIVVDGEMPGIDGSTVIRRIRLDAALRSTPCMMLTGSMDRAAELLVLEAGADAFVHKEEPVDVVLARLGAVLRGASRRIERSDAASLMGPKKILAVDDSSTYLHELTAGLGEGFAVAMARSGEEALELLAVESVDCILLDLVMPGLSGHETCRRIKEAPAIRDIPLIMLSSMEDRSSMLAGLSAGADDFVSKTAGLEILRARVQAQLRRKQLEDEKRLLHTDLIQRELEAAEARAARELAQTRAVLIEELELKNRELESFSYSVSHDLRAPLRAIDGFCAALQREYQDNVDERGQQYMRRVRAGAQRMGVLIDALLGLSRITRAPLQRQVADVSAIARELVQEHQVRDPARKVEVRIEDDLRCQADPRLLSVLLQNLLGNAWKFTGGTELAVIEVGHREDGTFFVRDNGAGFDMIYAEKLFVPFQRLHTASEFEGTGVGLATVQRVIARHRGRVWAESTVGEGATFFFTLGDEGPPSDKNYL